MKKTLGQNGLNFIANKYKELKELIGKKADKSEIKTKLSELTDDSTHRTVSDTEKSNWNNKIDKVSGKGLSTNDYDSTAKSKVDAIPANPKYTDTTYDLSKYAEKSNISRCKTKGYGSASSWSSVSTERDLEDWIGDFDKRTRELQTSGKGLTGDSSEFKQKSIPCNNASNINLLAVKWGRVVQLNFDYYYDSDRTPITRWQYTIPQEFTPSGFYRGTILNGNVEINTNNSNTEATMMVQKDPHLSSGEISGTVTYFARWQ